MKTALLTFAFLLCIHHSKAQSVSFSPKKSYSVDINPEAFCKGDFNRDGNIDFATANSNGSVSIVLGDGKGSFGASANFAISPIPKSICSADFNGDGKADLATINTGLGNVSILLGDGKGGFIPAEGILIGIYNSAATLCSSDFNSDGKADLIITRGFRTVYLALGTGDGNFKKPDTVGVNNATHLVVPSDFNNDGNVDIAVTTNSDKKSYISIVLGDGKGGFGNAVNFASGISPQSMIAGDLNGDGKIDLATANMGDNSTGNVSVLFGDGKGSFEANKDFSIGDATVPRSVCSGDFNGDGKIDIATATIVNNTTPKAAILMGDGEGNFGTPTNFEVDSYPNSILCSDFNGDGKIDLAVGTVKTNNDTGKVSVLLNSSTTDVSEFAINDASLQLYPNPCNGIFTIDTKAKNEICILEIYNLFGQKVNVVPDAQSNGSYVINLSKESAGVYIVRLYSGDRVYTESIVKK